MKNFKLTPETSYLIAVICGDGTIYKKEKKEYTIAITDKDKKFHENVLKPLIEENLNIKPSIKPMKNRNSWATVIRSKDFLEILTNSFGLLIGKNKTYVGSIPSQIFDSNLETILWHIAGWIDSEGSSKIKTYSTKYGSTKPILLKRKYRINQKQRYGISWNGIKKCSALLNYMKHPQKRENLKNKIFAASGRPI